VKRRTVLAIIFLGEMQYFSHIKRLSNNSAKFLDGYLIVRLKRLAGQLKIHELTWVYLRIHYRYLINKSVA
jgi:hypothetical protein